MRKINTTTKSMFIALLTVAAMTFTLPAECSTAASNAPSEQKIKAEKVVNNAAEKTTPAAAEKQTAETSKKAEAPAVKKEKENPFKATFWALLPPVLAILLALITKEVYSSLFLGILLGGCFAANFAPVKVMDLVIGKGLIEAIKGTSGIFLFLVLLGAIVGLINRSGASAAFGKWAKEHVKSRPGAIITTFLLGVFIFIDDYFNCLTVGSVMHPVTDAKRISRAKLAYIIDATAAPICMIAPISSWAAAVSQYVTSNKYSGIELFIKAIPYNFYSLLTIIFLLVITILKLDYGPMAKHEKNAVENNDLFSGREAITAEVKTEVNGNGRIVDMLIPIILLIVLCVFALLYVGGFSEGKNLAEALGNTDASIGLPWGALAAIIVIILYLGVRKTVSFSHAIECIPQGFIAMVPAVMILTLATSLKNMTELLHAKDFIAVSIKGAAPALTNILPFVIFLVACFLSFSTGTAWGTFGLLIPITIAIFPNTDPLFFAGISACLAGAVCGDHCSPISDTTIMSAAGAQCDLISHTSTQLPYALTVTVFSAMGFLLTGFIKNWFIVFPIVTFAMVLFLVVFKLVLRKKQRA